MPEEEHDRVNHICNTYRNVLIYLEKHNAYLPHVRPKFLLKYDQYILYETKIRPILGKKTRQQEPLSEEMFFLRSKQCWLDVVLQLFTTFVLYNKPRPRRKSFMWTTRSFLSSRKSLLSSRKSLMSSRSFASQSDFDILTPDKAPEIKIRKWLQFNYDQKKFSLVRIAYEDSVDRYPHTNIHNFTTDFVDGLILISVILAYCPYMEAYFKNIYLVVDCYEKAYHNATKIVKVLKKLNLSFELSALDIVEATMVNMIMFSRYCREVLPSMQANNKIVFEAALSNTHTQEIVLKNSSKYKAVYTVIFINNDMNCFEINRGETFHILPRKELKIEVTFTAKKITPTQCTLILSGETKGWRYSKSMVFVLDGTTIIDREHQAFSFEIPLYVVTTKNLNITAPYLGETTEYTYKITYEKVDKYLDIKTYIPFITGLKIKLANIQEKVLVCDEFGEGYINLTLAGFIFPVQEFWVIFFNKDVGDFYIRVELKTKLPELLHREMLSLELPVDWDYTKCTCTFTNLNDSLNSINVCRRFLPLRLPRRNNFLWKTIYDIFLQQVPEEDWEAWVRYLGKKNSFNC